MPELLLALDIGTTSARALVVDPKGRVLGGAKQPLQTHFPAPGRAEQDAALVWRVTLALIHDALASAGRTVRDIAAIGVTTQRASLVAWRRADGEPAAPMILWSDLSGAGKSRELKAAGFVGWPQAPACKLNALLDRCGDGDVLWGGLDSYLVYRLSGGSAHITDLSNAWLTGCLDPAEGGRWNTRLLDHLNLPEARFPRLVDTWGPLALSPARVLGAELPITAIIGDQQAGLFTHGGLGTGRWKATLGTSGVVMASTGEEPLRPHPTMPPEAVARRNGRLVYGVEGMVITAGAAVDWMCDGLKLFDSPEALCKAAAAASSSGISMRPSLLGLGAPHGRFAAGGMITGLHPGAGRADLARALLEGVAFRLREIADVLAAVVPTDEVLGVDGGLSASDEFLQILADNAGRPVRRLAVREGAAVGVALAAAMGADLLDEADLASRARYDRVFEPAISRDQSQSAYEAWARAVITPEA